ncbi:MAG: MFS transporter [Hyphomicrobiaceae bacterium]|nr:MFS transporter [Hyphomicrobiaceae bacterium]
MLAFIVFLIGYTLSQFYRSFLAVIAPELSSQLHLTATDLGNISACWFATFALSQFVVGAALDKQGPRRTLPALMLAGVAGAIVFARATDAYGAMIAMGLIGIGCSAALMGPLFVFARTSPPHRFALLSGLIIGLGTLGNLLGGTPLALASAAIGWRNVFYVLAAITFIAAALVAILIVDPPTLANDKTGRGGGVLSGLRDVLAIRELWPVWPIMAFGYGVLIVERGLWVGPYLSEVYGLTPISRGNVIFLMAAGIGLGALAYGPLEGWLRRRKSLALAGSAIAVAALGALAVLPTPSIEVATVLLCVFGFFAMTYGTIMAHVRLFLPDELLGRGMTFANFLCMSGASVLQVCSGILVDRLKLHGLDSVELFSVLHIVLAGLLLASSAIYAFSREKAN